MCLLECQEYQNQQKDESLIAHDIPTAPWTKVGTDLFELKGKAYLVVVDCTTNFFDISLLQNKRSATVVIHTKIIFSKFGIPKKVGSDNEPEYIGKDYKLFAKQWDFRHDSPSPHYPKSNGQVKRTIKTIKKTLKKAFKSKEEPYLAPLALRTSPGPDNNTPPATFLYSRPIRTILPSMNTNIAIKNKKIYRKSTSDECNYTNLPHLKKNDKVRLHDGFTWKIKGEIVEHLNKPTRLYLIRTENGNILRRNRKHILLSNGGNSDSYFKNETDDDEYLFNIYDKTNKTTNETPDNLCNEVEKATNVTRTRSGRIVKRSSRYDDYVMK